MVIMKNMISINEQRLIKTFLDLVKIDSPSGEEQEISKDIIKRLRVLGLGYKKDSFGNILTGLKGQGKSILYLAHLDTVEPGRDVKPVIKNNIIRSDGSTVLGADMKSAVAAILETIAYFKDNNVPHLPIEIIFTLQEELGLLGARALKKNNIKSKIGILFDGSGPMGGIALKEAGSKAIKIRLEGKAGHSGILSKNETILVKIAGKILSRLPLGKIGNDSSFNLGIIRGGDALNSIAKTIIMEGDIRSLRPKRLENLTQRIQSIVQKSAKEYGIKEMIEVDDVGSFYSIAKTSKLVKKISATLNDLGIKPRYYTDLGASEAGVLNKKGVLTIDLACGSREDHSPEENISIKDLILMTKILIKFALND